jgi:hypothetical protein
LRLKRGRNTQVEGGFGKSCGNLSKKLKKSLVSSLGNMSKLLKADYDGSNL